MTTKTDGGSLGRGAHALPPTALGDGTDDVAVA